MATHRGTSPEQHPIAVRNSWRRYDQCVAVQRLRGSSPWGIMHWQDHFDHLPILDNDYLLFPILIVVHSQYPQNSEEMGGALGALFDKKGCSSVFICVM